MMTHAKVPLGEVCTVNPRAVRTRYPDDMPVSFVPMAAVDERLGAITAKQERPIGEVSKGFTSFQEGDVLFAKITPCMENGKVAVARNLTNGIGRGSTEFHVLRPDGRVLTEYLYHFVRQARFREVAKRNFTGTAGQQRVPKSFMKNTLIPLPPLDEQRRIVSILNRAVKIEQLRVQAQELTREFIPSLFVRKFGDPIENPMGWEVATLGELCSVSIGRTPRRNVPRYWGGSHHWATIRDLNGATLMSTAQGITDNAINEVMPPPVEPNTLLFSFKLSIGKMAFAGCRMYHNEAIAALPIRNPNVLAPEFLHCALKVKTYDENTNHAVLGKVLNKRKVEEISILLPPIHEQRRIVRILNRMATAEQLHGHAVEATSSLPASLMSRLLEDARDGSGSGRYIMNRNLGRSGSARRQPN